jgi:uncharacterized repeat protein (TIGR02543 family)
MKYVFTYSFALLLTFLLTIGLWIGSVAQAAPASTIGVTTTLTINTVGQGVVNANPGGPTYDYGQAVTLTTTPATGWILGDWSGDVTATPAWWNSVARFRTAVSVGANGYLRRDKVVEAYLNFTALLNELGQSGAFDPYSIRVVEINAQGQVIDANVVFQFEKDNNYEKTTNAAGTLVFMMNGTTPANGGRTYHVYFDLEGTGLTTPTFIDQVTVTEVVDEQQDSFRIQTARLVWYYHQEGGGFSSLFNGNEDKAENKDWIGYHSQPGGSGGAFRGIPNMISPESLWHPGKIGTISVILHSGPIKETIYSITENGAWECLWEIFPTYARQTVLRIDTATNHKFWFLYEGTPDGKLDPNETPRDTMTLSDGTVRTNITSAAGDWEYDLPGEEWVYFSDPSVNRSIYVIHHEEDDKIDSYKFQQDSTQEPMTVLGFGRKNSSPAGPQMYTDELPAHFTVGLMDEVAYAPAAEIVRGAYKELALVTGPTEERDSVGGADPGNSTMFVVHMTTHRNLTATFTLPSYTLSSASNPATGGSIIVTPTQISYLAGTQLSLLAAPAAGYTFAGWSGALTGSTNPAVLTMDGNQSVTANFTPGSYTLVLNTVGTGSGSATRDPLQSSYPYGQIVLVTATANPGSTFTGWSGALSGTVNPVALFMDGSKTLTANFSRNQYTLVMNTNGGGSVNANPASGPYPHGAQLVLTATPSTGWSFSRWTGSLTGSTNPATLSMDSNKSVFALFTQNLYALTTGVTGSGTITRSPAKSGYTYGEQVTLTATPAPGWSFQGWSGGLTGANNPATVTTSADAVITAVFVQN